MKTMRIGAMAGTTALAVVLSGPAGAGTLRCAADAVKVGTTCVDKYEASVWQIPPSNTSLVKHLQAGKATLAELTAAGAVQLGCTFVPYGHTDFPAGFPVTGNWTPVAGVTPPSPGVFAVSVAGVVPSACISWLQAGQACAASGKRLLTNEEWQRASAGTADPGAADDTFTTCATNSANPVATGSRAACASSWGAADMVGNVWEWVGEWGTLADDCTHWPASFGDDTSCVGGPGSTFSNLPGVMRRGGRWNNTTDAGVFAVNGDNDPSEARADTGFRCGR
jgi:hypothetical protein